MKKSKLLLVLSTAAMMSLASCSGSEGPMGPAGPQGAKGDKGSDGVSITSVVKTGTSGLEDTYTITFSDGNSTTFKIVNGEDGDDGDDGHSPQISINQEGYWCVDGTSLGVKAKGDKGDSGADGISIVGVQLTSSVGLVDTYTITYSNSETSTFTVTNGEKGDKGDAGVSIVSVAFKSSSGLEDTYTITFSDGNTTDFVIKNGEDGEDGDTPEITINEDGYWCVNGTSLGVKAKGDKGDAGDDGVSIVSVVKTSSEGLVDTYTITYSNSETSTFTVTNGEKGEKGDPGETAWSNTILPVTGGYVVPSIGSGVVGEEITFTAFAAEDYTATALLLNGEQVILDENGQYTTTMVEHGFVVQGIFVRSNVVPEGADATEIQEYLDSLEAGSTVKFKYDHVLNKRITINKDLTIVGGGVVSGIDKGSFGVAEGVNATFQGFKFGTFHNDTNNLSPVYAQKLTSKVVFDSCTFDEADWDSIQLVPTASTAEIVINNCEFNILATQKHVIHIEPTKTGPTDLVGLEIVGNTFNGVDTFGGDLICITRVTNINSALKAGDNVFDDELKLQVPPTYEGNVYVADPSGFETTFLVDSLTSAVSDEKQYFSVEIYLPETGDVAELSAFLAKVPEGSVVVFKKSVSLTGNLSISKDLTIKCANEDVVVSSDAGSFYVGNEIDVIFKNVNFGTFHRDSNKGSTVYAEHLEGSVEFDGCTFGASDWDSLQLLPAADTATIKITNCEFNISPTQKRVIHIQPSTSIDVAKIEIVGNTFNGVDTFGGDLLCINNVSNIDETLVLGENEFDDKLKLQVPPTYVGNIYVEGPNGIETTFLVDSLTSEVSDDKQYFSDEIYLPETGDVSALSSFLAKVPEGSVVVFKKSVSLTGNLSITKDLTIKCANEDVVISSDAGSFYIGNTANVTFKDFNFGTFHKDSNKSSTVYAEHLEGAVEFDSCTFGYADWDMLQLLPAADTASIKITNCEFNISPTQKRVIHIQPSALTDIAELEITGNTFNGADAFDGDLICINKVSNIESVLKVGKNVSDEEFKLQTPPSYEGNVYLADNAQGEVRFKVEALSGAEIVTGADAFAKHGEIAEDPLNIDEAYALAKSLGSGKTSDNEYFIQGKVTYIESAYSSQFGNITLQAKTTDNKVFKLYRVTCTQEEANQIVVGSSVMVKGYITNYSGSTMETSAGGTFVSILNELSDIKISGKSQIALDETTSYTAQAVPSIASLETVTWEIESGADYISLPETKTGTTIEVTGVAEGTAVLKATSSAGKSSTITITVKGGEILPTDIDLPTTGTNVDASVKAQFGTDATQYSAIKLGTASKAGSATITVKAGSSKLIVYGAGWNKKTANLTVSYGDGKYSTTKTITSDTGASGNSPFTLTCTKDTNFEFDFGSPLSVDTVVTLSTNVCVVIWSIQSI